MTKRLTQEERNARYKAAEEELRTAEKALQEAKKKYRYASNNRYPQTRVPRREPNEFASRIIDLGYKELAKEVHPDKGGSHVAMTRLNQARKELKARA